MTKENKLRIIAERAAALNAAALAGHGTTRKASCFTHIHTHTQQQQQQQQQDTQSHTHKGRRAPRE